MIPLDSEEPVVCIGVESSFDLSAIPKIKEHNLLRMFLFAVISSNKERNLCNDYLEIL